MRERDFEEIKHHGGISPAWPIKYEDLNDYYTKAEKLYHVHGLRGSDPTEPPCRTPYFYPPVKHEPRIQKLFDDLTRIGHHPFPLPIGLRLNEEQMEKSPCIKCNTCDGFPCLVDAKADGMEYYINYNPAESETALFGGNSNWRGPVWLPINFLIIESLQKFHHYYGDELKVDFPTGSGNKMNLWEVAKELSKRLISLFKETEGGKRPIFEGQKIFSEDPHWKNLILFNEYFHGDTGAGLGASYQTGWTGLVAKLIQQSGGK